MFVGIAMDEGVPEVLGVQAPPRIEERLNLKTQLRRGAGLREGPKLEFCELKSCVVAHSQDGSGMLLEVLDKIEVFVGELLLLERGHLNPKQMHFIWIAQKGD
jgi:hypothetical protein